MMNPYYPYQYNQINPYGQQMAGMQQLQNLSQPIQPQQIQSGGFVVVQSEDEALRYPIAPGKSITFKVENQPIVIEKTMGFSQLESPKIERFRLVKEDSVPQQAAQELKYAPVDEVASIRSELETLRGDFEALRERIGSERKENKEAKGA